MVCDMFFHYTTGRLLLSGKCDMIPETSHSGNTYNCFHLLSITRINRITFLAIARKVIRNEEELCQNYIFQKIFSGVRPPLLIRWKEIPITIGASGKRRMLLVSHGKLSQYSAMYQDGKNVSVQKPPTRRTISPVPPLIITIATSKISTLPNRSATTLTVFPSNGRASNPRKENSMKQLSNITGRFFWRSAHAALNRY